MKSLKIVGYALALALTVISCRRDDETIEAVIQQNGYRNGILVANEGNFGRPNANISYISGDLSKIDNDLYTTINGENMGDVFQNVGFADNNAYFVMNNSNKIIVADRYTLVKKAEITEHINQPRYIAFSNQHIYVTNSSDKTVSVYNKSNNSFVKSIPIFDTTERIANVGDYIFVQNAAWGTGKKITQISTQSNEVVDIIPVEETSSANNIQKILPYNNALYVLTSSANSSNSYIHQYDHHGDLDRTITLTGISNAKNIDIDNDVIYFTSGTGVYAMPITGNTPRLLFNVNDNSWSTLYGFNVIGNYIYTADAKGFTQGSEVNVYTTAGQFVKTFTAGMGVNAFYKN